MKVIISVLTITCIILISSCQKNLSPADELSRAKAAYRWPKIEEYCSIFDDVSNLRESITSQLEGDLDSLPYFPVDQVRLRPWASVVNGWVILNNDILNYFTLVIEDLNSDSLIGYIVQSTPIDTSIQSLYLFDYEYISSILDTSLTANKRFGWYAIYYFRNDSLLYRNLHQLQLK